MTFDITDFLGQKVALHPRLELYTVHDFMGQELPGIAIALDFTDPETGKLEQYAILTKSFGEFIGLKNSAYIDTNNCYFAQQLLEQGMAKDTGFYKESGYCTYPLWQFEETFLQKIGREHYETYAQQYDAYMQAAFAPEEMEDSSIELQ